MGGCVTKDQAISHAQYLDLVYSKYGTLYEMLPNAPRPSSYLTTSKSLDTPPVDGVIGYVSQTSTKSSSKQKSVLHTCSHNPSKNSSSSGKTSEVHAIQSTAIDKAYKGKRKGKGKAKADAPKYDPPKSSVDGSSKRKPKYPCLICEEDHYTKDCPRCFEVNCLLKGNPTVLKEPFTSQHMQLVDQPQSYASSGSQVFMMQGSSPISISNRTKHYQTTPKYMVEKEVTNTPTSTLSSSGPLHIECPNSESVI